MRHEYRRFHCRVCGEVVFVPLPDQSNPEYSNGNLGELTCSKGHTDAYDFSEMEEPRAKPAASLKIKRAMAGIG